MDTTIARFEGSAAIHATSVAPCEGDIPLCCDLDGTLLRGDTMAEGVASLLRRGPHNVLKLAAWALSGRSALKKRLAHEAPIDVAALPYEAKALDLLRKAKREGRRIILATAANHSVANSVAQHLGLFDAVIASTDRANLKNGRKLQAVMAELAGGEFDFIGNDLADAPCFRAARRRVAVNPTMPLRRLIKRDRLEDVEVIETRQGLMRALFHELRLYQWVKNLLILLPLLLAHHVTDIGRLLDVGATILAFGCAASAAYVVNDLLDLEADRRHPVKRQRPLASGELSLTAALLAAAVGLVLALSIAASIDPVVLAWTAGYIAITLGYSLWLKRLLLVDVLTLAGLYTARIVVGGAAAHVAVSQWLLAFSMFFFLGLAFLKRYTEVSRLDSVSFGLKPVSRDYLAEDADELRILGTASGFLAVLVLALYLNSNKVTVSYPHAQWLWLSCVFVAYWIARVWMLAGRGQMSDDPVTFAMRDPATYVLLGLTALTLLLAL